MSRITPKMRDLASLLITWEMRGKEIRPNTSSSVGACEMLRPHLANLMGNVGVRALHLHALALGNAEVPWLSTVQVKTDGSLEGLEEPHVKLEPEDLFNGQVVLLAQVLGLLVTFIGENLTLHLVHEVWPEGPLDKFDSIKGDGNECH